MFAWLAAITCVLSYTQRVHGYPWFGFYSDFLIAVSLVSLVFHLLLKSKSISFRPPAFSLFFVALVAIAVGQTLSGYLPVAGDGWMSALYCGGALLAYWVGALFRRQPKTPFLIYFCLALLLAALVSALIGMLQWLDLPGPNLWLVDSWQGSRAKGNLAQPNHLNSLLMIGVASVIYLFERRHIGVLSVALLAFFLMITVVLAQSRTGWLQVTFIVVWWLFRRRAAGLRMPVTPYIVMPAMFVLLSLSLPSFTEAMHFFVGPAAREFGASDPIRPTLWRAALYAIGQQPFWGYGWNQVAVAYSDVMHLFPGSVWATGAHNLVLDLMLWNGLVPGVLLSAALAWWGGSRIWRCRSLDGWYALLVVGVVMVHAMVEKPLHYAFFLFPVALLMGWVDGCWRDRHSEVGVEFGRCDRTPPEASIVRLRVLLACVALTATSLLSWLWHDYRLVEEDFLLLRFEQVNMRNSLPDPRAENVVLTSVVAESIKNARRTVTDDMTADELEMMGYLTYRTPISTELARYAYALAINGQPDQAALVIRKLENLWSAQTANSGMQYLRTLAASEPRVAALLAQQKSVSGGEATDQ